LIGRNEYVILSLKVKKIQVNQNMYAKISKKGQITIPKAVREKLNIAKGGGVLFLFDEEEIKLKGIPGSQGNELAGRLKKYVKKYVPLSKVRKHIQKEIAKTAAGEGLPQS
jgi:AbrB family looped-hinge helix DNA binding protein